MEIHDKDIQIEIPKSIENNETVTAVRLTHIPTGKSVLSNTAKSQVKNVTKGKEMLAKLIEEEA